MLSMAIFTLTTYCPWLYIQAMQFKLKDLLATRGITGYRLAKDLGVSYPAVAAWLNGRKRGGVVVPVYPEYETLERICQVLRCKVGDLLVFDEASS
jgi:DNA-binding Xre family transcriptional regulator